jgi:hypothetical protein
MDVDQAQINFCGNNKLNLQEMLMTLLRAGLVIIGMTGILLAAHGQTVTRSVPLTGSVTRVYLNGTHELHLTQGEEQYVKLTAPEAMLSRVEARVKGKSLYLGRDQNWGGSSWGSRSSKADRSVRFDVQLAHIDAIRVRGSGRAYAGNLDADRLKIIMYGSGTVVTRTITARDVSLEMSGSCDFSGDRINSEEMEMEINGSGKIHINDLESDEIKIVVSGSGAIKLEKLTAAEFDTVINGSGDLELAGRVGSQGLEINGSGDYQASKLISNDADVEIRGSGNVTISVQKQLTAEISRGAELVYYGGQELEADISGRGRSRNAGNIHGN